MPKDNLIIKSEGVELESETANILKKLKESKTLESAIKKMINLRKLFAKGDKCMDTILQGFTQIDSDYWGDQCPYNSYIRKMKTPGSRSKI